MGNDIQEDPIRFEKYSLGSFPTPLESLDRLSARLGGPRIWMKRDDLLGLGLGGNKVRKLELFLAEARRRDCDTLLTVGAGQSNHVRLTAAAARRAGMKCEALLFAEPQGRQGGNLLLDRILGADLHRLPFSFSESTPARMAAAVDQAMKRIESGKGRPYFIPAGGAGDPGQVGYVGAVEEIREQGKAAGIPIGHLVTAVGTGGTLAGLLLGIRLYGCRWEILAVSAVPRGLPGKTGLPSVGELVRTGARWLGKNLPPGPEEPDISYEFVGDGYGIPTAASEAAIRLVAEEEGILLDPVYTSKAMAGLVSAIREGRFRRQDVVIFLHTGGTPALFSQAPTDG
ncbi:MAG: pyridoxal-phosphate dependent enzyme [Acidobacteriota bacterium]